MQFVKLTYFHHEYLEPPRFLDESELDGVDCAFLMFVELNAATAARAAKPFTASSRRARGVRRDAGSNPRRGRRAMKFPPSRSGVAPRAAQSATANHLVALSFGISLHDVRVPPGSFFALFLFRRTVRARTDPRRRRGRDTRTDEPDGVPRGRRQLYAYGGGESSADGSGSGEDVLFLT